MKASASFLRHIAGALAGLPLLLSSISHAQTTAQTTASLTSDDELVTLSEFIITTERDVGYLATNAVSATRVNTQIKDLPLNMSVLPREFLDDAAIFDIGSSIQWMASNTGSTDPRIRGLSSNMRVNGFGGSERDDSISFSRVEVIKGPGAIMSGSGAPGGIVNVVTKRPTWNTSLSLAQFFGNEDYLRTEIDGETHFGRTFAVRAAVAVIDEGEFSSQRAKQEWDDHYKKEQTYYFVGQWRPARATTVTAAVTYLNQDRPFRDQPNVRWDTYGRLSPGAGLPSVYLIEAPYNFRRGFGLTGPDAHDDVENTIVDFEVLHEFSPNLQVKLLANGKERSRLIFGPASTGLVTASQSLVDANPGQGLVVGERYFSVRWDSSEQVNPWGWNYEINALWKNAKGDDAEHRVLVGANTGSGTFWSQSGRGRAPVTNAEQRFYFRFGDMNPNTGRPASLNMVYDARSPLSETIERNAFFVHQGKFFDAKLHTLAGLFYYDYSDERVTSNVLTINKNDGVNPQLGFVYSLNRSTNFYAVYAKSIQGQNRRNSRGEILPPFEGVNYEIGLKVETPDGRYSGTVSLFQTDFLNRQFNDPTVLDINGNPGERVSSGEDRSRGLDTEFVLTLRPNWQMIAGYAWLDTEVVKDRGDQPWRIGQRFNNHAFHNYSIWTRYHFAGEFMKGLSVGGGIRGDSGAIREYRTVDGVPQPSEETVDPYVELFFSYRRPVGKAEFFSSLNVRNVTRQESHQFFKDNSTEPYFVWKKPVELFGRVGIRF